MSARQARVAAYVNNVARRRGRPRPGANARALLAAFVVPAPIEQVTRIDAFIAALEAAGVWDKLDALYVTAAHDAQAARLNWKAPGTFTLVPAGGPVFTAYRGYKGDSVDATLNTGANASLQSKFIRDSAHIGAWVNGGTDVGGTILPIGMAGSLTASIRPRTGTNTLSGNINVGTTANFNAVATAYGDSLLNRSGATAVQAYKNGAAHGVSAGASTAVASDTFVLLRASTIYSDFQVAVAHWGSSLTAGEVLALYNAKLAYLTALGAN